MSGERNALRQADVHFVSDDMRCRQGVVKKCRYIWEGIETPGWRGEKMKQDKIKIGSHMIGEG